MTNLELLFREYGRDKPIRYEEFLAAGWTKEKYLEYLRRCEVVRSGVIFIENYLSVLEPEQREKKQRKHPDNKALLQEVLNSFLNWLGNEMGCSIKPINIIRKDILGSYACTYLLSIPKIFLTAEDFRFELERFINIQFTADFGQLFGDDLDSLSDEEIIDEKERIEQILRKNLMPEEPDYNSYYSIQKWASAHDEYNRAEQLQYTIDDLEEELEKRKRIFNQSEDTLFIFSGSKVCKNSHESIIESVTAIIKGIYNQTIKMNIHYCPECKKYFLSYNEYNRYREEYKCLPIIMQYVGETGKYDYHQRDEFSFLSLAGYTVSKQQGLSEADRREILIKLLENKYSKNKIINHLEMLIHTNGSNIMMSEARRKWEDDLRFVRDYNIDKQRKVIINEIKRP